MKYNIVQSKCGKKSLKKHIQWFLPKEKEKILKKERRGFHALFYYITYERDQIKLKLVKNLYIFKLFNLNIWKLKQVKWVEVAFLFLFYFILNELKSNRA